LQQCISLSLSQYKLQQGYIDSSKFTTVYMYVWIINLILKHYSIYIKYYTIFVHSVTI